MTVGTETPRVWIGCLASYNAGRLIGEWVDAVDLDEMLECQRQVAAQAVEAAKEAGEWPVYFTEPEEFFLADHEGFGDLIGEYTPLEKVAELGEAIEEHGKSFVGFCESLGVEYAIKDVSAAVEEFEERREFCGTIEQMVQDEEFLTMFFGCSSEELARFDSYLDYEMLARTMDHEGYRECGDYVIRPG